MISSPAATASAITLRSFLSACAADTRTDAQKWLADPLPHRSAAQQNSSGTSD
jgi:hypothetical protein